MLLKIVLKNIWQKRLSSFLSILLMAFGVCIISIILKINKKIEYSFSKNIKGIDMVVGAKGSPLQLILSAVFQMDNPTGNVKLADVNALKNNPLIKKIIPLSMGDNFAGFRIIGTNTDYVNHFNGVLNKGIEFKNDMEVVIGSEVAITANLNLNAEIESAHGLDKDGEKHDHEHLKVVGILKPSGTVLDKLIICNLNTINELHHQTMDSSSEITSALIKFRSPLGLMTIPRNINANTNMMAALPAIEINRLFELLGVGIDGLKYLAWAIILISGISVFISIFNALKERKYELALMLSMGASRLKLFTMLLIEGLILCIIGYFIGLFISNLGLYLGGNLFKSQIGNFGFWNSIEKEEIYLLIAALLVGIFAAVIPAAGIYKINIAKTLAKD